LISTEEWPAGKEPFRLFTSGGVPFLGEVQQRNLPYIIPLKVLPTYRKKPTAFVLESPEM